MSVYTPLSHSQLALVLDSYGYRLLDFRAASHGIENSTFLIEAQDRHQQPAPLVLTIFETLDHDALAPYLVLLGHLAEQGLPVPAPLTDHHGQDQITVAGKPAVLMPRLPGEHDFAVDLDRCRQVGALLARLHRCDTGALLALPDERRRLETLATQLNQLPYDHREGARALLSDWQARPAGTTLIHGDLFRDNLLWQ